MGQQQLLFIVLGVIIVGVAIIMGIELFGVNAVESKRNEVINEAFHLTTLAWNYYKKPTTYGGGSYSFEGWDVPPELQVTASGTFSATATKDSVVIIGTGNEEVTAGDSVKIRCTVFPHDYQIAIIN